MIYEWTEIEHHQFTDDQSVALKPLPRLKARPRLTPVNIDGVLVRSAMDYEELVERFGPECVA